MTFYLEIEIVDVVGVEYGWCTQQHGAVTGDGVAAQLACLLNQRRSAWCSAIVSLKSPPAYMINGMLTDFMVDPLALGGRAARLADQVLRGGTASADLLVETADAIELDIPDGVLSLADTCCRAVLSTGF